MAVNMSDVVITRYPNHCDITGNYPVNKILEFTSTINRGLADYQKKQRGSMESKVEIDLLQQIWNVGNNGQETVLFEGKELTVEETKNVLPPKSSQSIMSVVMAGKKALNGAISRCIDDSFSVFDHLEKRFPVGILPEVETVLTTSNIDYEVVDARVKPDTVYVDWALKEAWTKFRAPQEKMLELCKKHEHFGIEWCVGSGKTLGITIPVVEHKVATLVVVPSIELVKQTASDIAEYTNIPANHIGLCFANEHNLRPVTVVTLQTLEKNLEEFVAFGYKQLIVDEAHFAGARGLYEAINEIDSYYRYFSSGTLYRLDHIHRVPGRLDIHEENILLKALIGEIKDYRSYQDGVDAGYLSKVEVICVDSGPKLEGCSYREARSNGVVNNLYRNNNFCQKIKDQIDLGKTVLCLVVETDHAVVLRDMLEDYDVEAGVITGKTKSAERSTILNSIRHRLLKCVIGTSCIRTGVNISTLDVVANIGGMKSYRTTIQGTGRGTRTGSLINEDGLVEYIKGGAIIIDSMDEHNVNLASHGMARMKAYHREGFSVPHLEKYFKEKEVERKFRQKNRLVKIKKMRATRNKKLPNLKKQLIDLVMLRDDPDANSNLSLIQIKKQISRVQKEINSISAQNDREAKLEDIEGEVNDS